MELEPLRQIGRRFSFNLERVEHLLTVYKSIEGNSDLKPEYHSDVLRSAVVLMHAAMEDLLREMMRLRAAQDPTGIYKDLDFPPLPGANKIVNKVTVGELHRFRGMTVDTLIDECVANYLSKKSFNNKNDIISAIELAGLTPGDYASHFDSIIKAVARRHKIVHEGDRVSHNAKTHGKRNHLSENDVRRWLGAVTDLGKLMLANATPTEEV